METLAIMFKLQELIDDQLPKLVDNTIHVNNWGLIDYGEPLKFSVINWPEEDDLKESIRSIIGNYCLSSIILDKYLTDYYPNSFNVTLTVVKNHELEIA